MSQKPEEIIGSLITIGDEILSGHIGNSNAHYIASELHLNGFRLANMVTVGDQEKAIRRALLEVVGRAHFIICTGGLGPTDDDRTVAAVADALERPAEKLGNDVTAAGFFLEHWNTPCYFLPGVPSEMRMFMEEHVLPDLFRRFPTRPLYRKRILRVQGLPESLINERLEDLDTADLQVEIGYLPQTAENWVTLLATAEDTVAAEELLQRADQEVVRCLGADTVSGRDDEALEVVIGRLLRVQSWKLAVAESCTGGLLAERITAVPGASDYMDRGFVTYSNTAKVELLGVPPEILSNHGAVSHEVAKAMAEGARSRARVDIAVAITGVAGPSGGTPGKPVGTVFVACATASRTLVLQHRFSGNRRQIQEKSAQATLVLLWKQLMA
jgi:nicotinamide-nucleotide amidase